MTTTPEQIDLWRQSPFEHQRLEFKERFHLPENKSAITSQVISATIEAGLIKPDERVGISRKFPRYLPFWA
jgi:ATP-dependent DNA helicase RecG